MFCPFTAHHILVVLQPLWDPAHPSHSSPFWPVHFTLGQVGLQRAEGELSCPTMGCPQCWGSVALGNQSRAIFLKPPFFFHCPPHWYLETRNNPYPTLLQSSFAGPTWASGQSPGCDPRREDVGLLASYGVRSLSTCFIAAHSWPPHLLYIVDSAWRRQGRVAAFRFIVSPP